MRLARQRWRRPTPATSHERRERVSALYGDGVGVDEIAKTLGISRQGVAYIINRLGLEPILQRKLRLSAERRAAQHRAIHERGTKLDQLFRASRSSPEECWPWAGLQAEVRPGFKYGRYGGRYAHRLSWERHCGPIPSGMVVCHRCDNPPCVNPAHLFLGTQRDNIHDSVQKGRWGLLHRRRKAA